VLVYSVLSRLSFIWIKEFHKGLSAAVSVGLVLVMLIRNKSDSFTEHEVLTQEGYALAKKLGFEFVKASAKNSTNVEKAFYNVVQLLHCQL
jgi:GTPase KRas